MRAAAGGVSLVVATDREFAILANQRADVRRDRTPRAPEMTIHSRLHPELCLEISKSEVIYTAQRFLVAQAYSMSGVPTSVMVSL